MSTGLAPETAIKTQSDVGLSWRDFTSGLNMFPLALELANQDMSTRYARTTLGPMWGVVGVAMMSIAMGLTFGVIFGQPLRDFLPYLAASLAIWNGVSAFMVEGPSAFHRHAGIINFYNLPLTVQIFRGVIDKLNMMFHALIVYVVMIVIFQVNPFPSILVFPAFLVVFCVFGVGVMLLLGVLGARYRDLGPALSSLMLLVFLITPIFWQKAAVAEHPWIATINPFYHLLEIGRGPLLGYFPTALNWIVAGGTALGAFALGLLVFLKGRRSIFYWM